MTAIIPAVSAAAPALRLPFPAGRAADVATRPVEVAPEIAALALDGVHKSFRAGIPGCSVAARVLAGVTLRLRPGEAVGVTGAAGAGKTALLLCAAGLLVPDEGTVSWFGCPARLAPGEVGPAAYFPAGAASSAGEAEEAIRSGVRLLIVDHVSPASLEAFLGGIAHAARRRGAALLVACRDGGALRRLALRTVVLQGGRLCGEVSVAHASRRSGQRNRLAARASSAFPSDLACSRIRST